MPWDFAFLCLFKAFVAHVCEIGLIIMGMLLIECKLKRLIKYIRYERNYVDLKRKSVVVHVFKVA
jgi:hypothetical protein